MNDNKGSGPFFDGLEIGAVSVKWVRRLRNGLTIAEIAPHGGNPRKEVQQIFDGHEYKDGSRIVVTGQAARTLFDLPYRSETECLEKALSFLGLKPDILISLGGETFSVYPVRNGIIKNIISTSKCAAGSGEFIVQQFQRMGMSMEEGIDAANKGEIIQLATRCSVHCKSDATHKLNKGECTPGDIAKSLIHDLAKKISEMVEVAQWPARSIIIAGGVASNALFVDYFRSFFNDTDVAVLTESPYLEAFGASLYASELLDSQTPSGRMTCSASKIEFKKLQPLKEAQSFLDYRVDPGTQKEIIEGASYILGVDAGSTTTKAVLLNHFDGSVGAACYLRTLGNPVRATRKCLADLIKQVGQKSITIIQAGVTGSAREMVSVYLDNCLSFNEILAHARAAAREMPDVDTVFEIGGQDSKFISFLNGVPVDYAMNEGCSAGTGSFLEESASVDMGVAVKDISDIAEGSHHPIAFGERCAAFINTDLRNALQQGASRDDVTAGLVYSIADNYISRIVGPRHVGENLLFLGGVALNRSVALAMAARANQKIVVPPHPQFMGSVGTALMARDLLQDGGITEHVRRLGDLVSGEMEVKGTFRCKACENKCEIERIGVGGKVYPFGGVCSKYERQRHGETRAEGLDLIAVRNKIMFDEFGPENIENPCGTIGLPMVLTTFELFPFYAKLIHEFGYDVVLSNPSTTGNARTIAPICNPCELVHGAVYDLKRREVDYIFLPHVIELKGGHETALSYTCPSTTVIPDIIRAAFGEIRGRILSPHIALSRDFMQTTLKEIGHMGSVLGLKKNVAERACEKALLHYEKFRQNYQARIRKELKKIQMQPVIIIAGRPYVICSSDVNLALPRNISSRGYHVISSDMLPLLENSSHPRNVWHFTRQINNAVAHVQKNPNLHICLVSCFACGPDASIYHYFRQELAGHAFCYLEIDSHTAHAGFETRVGAFLDIIEEHMNI